MTSFHSSQPILTVNTHPLRRSDRKKTKKIIKDDFMLPNPFKGKLKKHRGLRLPQKLDSQIKKIQFLTETALATLNYGNGTFSLEMLNQMKQAVNQQQIKLYDFLSIKLTEDNITYQNQIPLKPYQPDYTINQKQNTPIFYQFQPTFDEFHLQQFHKGTLGMTTTEQLYKDLQESQNQDYRASAFHEESEQYLQQQPKFRKQGSKLLSDNYENHELMYTIGQIIPDWHHEDIQLDPEPEFSS